MDSVEAHITRLLSWAILTIELIGALLIISGVVRSIASALLPRHASFDARYARARMILARYLVLALEYQLAADVLHTAIRPSWEQIGELAAIAAIRTFLNFFLEREMKGMEIHHAQHAQPAQSG